MPELLAIRFARFVPVLLVLAIVGAIIFAVVEFKYSKPKAKEILIILFYWINLVGAVFFALAALYAWFEGNELAFDLMACFSASFLIFLIIDLICKARFLRNNPHYKFPSTKVFIQTGWRRLWNRAKKVAKDVSDKTDGPKYGM